MAQEKRQPTLQEKKAAISEREMLRDWFKARRSPLINVGAYFDPASGDRAFSQLSRVGSVVGWGDLF